MKLTVKRTNELSSIEKHALCALFQDVFHKPRSLESFEREFARPELGGSYHCLLFDDKDDVVGSYTSIPVRYLVGDEEHIFGLSVDTMIRRGVRGKGHLKRMAEDTYARLAEDGIPFVFGFPNENIYLIRKKILSWTDIGNLSYYLLPLGFGRDRRLLRLFDHGLRSIAWLANWYVESGDYAVEQEKFALVPQI